MIKNIIFDWSGTLSDDLINTFKAVMIVFNKLGIPKISFNEFQLEYTLPYMNFYKKYEINIQKAEIDSLYLEAMNTLRIPTLFRGVRQVLKFFLSKNIMLALISSHPKESLEKEIKFHKLEDVFLIIRYGIYEKTKIIEKFIEECEFDKNQTAYVGDTIQDIKAGKKAGVYTIAISWGYESIEKLKMANPDLMINNILQLKKMLTLS